MFKLLHLYNIIKNNLKNTSIYAVKTLIYDKEESRVIHLEAQYICIFSGATLWSSYLLYIWANIAGDNIRPTFDILTDVHPSLPTRALLTKIHSDQFISSFQGFLGIQPRLNEIMSAVINHNLCVAIYETG